MPEGSKDEGLRDSIIIDIEVVCKLYGSSSKSTGLVFVRTYLLVHVSCKVGQRGQVFVVLKCCRGSESFRCDGRVDKIVLDALLSESQAPFA